MLILGIDTAAAPCCAAVYDTEKQQILGSTVINNKLTHSVTLMPVVRDLVRNAELSMEDIGLFAVANGPGSFTGLRIGISAVKGLAFALSKPCAAVSTLEAMAYNVTAYDCVVCAAMDARCNQVYVALFRIEDGKVERLTEEECLKTDEAARMLSDYGVCLAAVNAPQLTPEQLMPMYLKLPQAQRELMAKNAEAYKERKE